MSVYTTKQRTLLLELLRSHADETLSAEEIAKMLGSEGVSISAIYRNLAALESEGKLQRVTKGGSRRVY
ncbi:MAG: transcriptional repressor, partial [Ruminococcus sp.]|nr:transcriptional repressor [Ruminococcus sp.]